MTRRKPSRHNADEDVFMHAVDMALLLLRANAARSGVCPRCYCAAVVAALATMGDSFDHGERVMPLELDELQAMKLNLTPEDEMFLSVAAGHA